MNNLKTFFLCGLYMLFINFIIINLLTLYYDINKTNVDINLKLFNLPLVIIERTPKSFGYTFMNTGMIASILIGGIIGLLFKFIKKSKK